MSRDGKDFVASCGVIKSISSFSGEIWPNEQKTARSIVCRSHSAPAGHCQSTASGPAAGVPPVSPATVSGTGCRRAILAAVRHDIAVHEPLHESSLRKKEAYVLKTNEVSVESTNAQSTQLQRETRNV